MKVGAFATMVMAFDAYQKAEGQFELAEEEVEDIEKAIERCETLPKVEMPRYGRQRDDTQDDEPLMKLCQRMQ